MATQKSLDEAYMGCAQSIAGLSYATRQQVGAILVNPKIGIIAEGVNGMPSKFPNECEYVYDRHKYADESDNECLRCHKRWPFETIHECVYTRPECLHAESNAITKVARSTNSSVGTTLYTTLSPCFDCAKLMIQAGITRVVYQSKYRDQKGVELLRRANIQVDELHK